MAQIEVTEESLRAAVDEAVFAQAVTLAGKVAGFSAVGPQIEAIVDGTEVSVRVKPFGLDAHCACPAPSRGALPARGRRGAHLGPRRPRPGRRPARRTR